MSGFFSKFFFGVLQNTLPDRTKRLILLSSLCGKIRDEDELTDDYLSLLNTQFSLCGEENALKFPIAIRKAIWPDNIAYPKHAVLDHDQCETAALDLSKYIPGWLKYESDDVIVEDVSSLLQFDSTFESSQRMQSLL